MSKLFCATVAVLACTISTQAIRVLSVPRSVADLCPDAQVLGSSAFSVGEYDIVHQTFACPDGNFSIEAFSNIISDHSPSRPPSLEARSQAECTTPETTCQCGTPGIPIVLISKINWSDSCCTVDCACFTDGIPPSTNDCRNLIASTAVISSLQGPTFMIQPNTIHAITLNTCTLGFLNLANFVEEFCWDDFVSVVPPT